MKGSHFTPRQFICLPRIYGSEPTKASVFGDGACSHANVSFEATLTALRSVRGGLVLPGAFSHVAAGAFRGQNYADTLMKALPRISCQVDSDGPVGRGLIRD